MYTIFVADITLDKNLQVNYIEAFKHTPMNPMNHKALILSIPMILAVFLLGGWLLFREPQSPPESQNPPVGVENPPQNAGNLQPPANIDTSINESGENNTSLKDYLALSRKEFENKKGEILSTLGIVRSSNLLFPEKKGNINFFQKTFEFSEDPWMNFNVLVYDYKKGASYSEAYEGLRWTIQFDDHVKTFQSLKPGVQDAIVIGHLGNENASVNFRKIGSQYYEVYDLGFKPGGNYTRYYVTFDEKRSRFVLLTFSYAFYSQEFSIQEEGAKDRISYPKEIQEILFDIERVIENS